MSSVRRNRRLKKVLGAGAIGFAALLLSSTASLAQFNLLPADFMHNLPKPSNEPAAVEADVLAYDADANVISAQGNVVLKYQGYTAQGSSLSYNVKTGEVHFVGPVQMVDPSGVVYQSDNLEVTGGMREAFLRSLTITTPAGAVISASDVHFSRELRTVLIDATYSPCGDCIDDKGRRIGWRIRAARLTYDNETQTYYLDQPRLEVLGIPVAWLPFLSVPNLSERKSGFRLPSVGYNEETGARVTVPYFFAAGKSTDLLFTPTLFSNQGVLLGAELTQRFMHGSARVKVSGIYQMHPEAFGSEVADRPWRGAIQTSGQFRPVKDWTLGWSYTAFTDTAYLPDYRQGDSKSRVNEVFATHFDPDSFYADLHIQRLNILGDHPEAAQQKQALTLPNAEISKVLDLGNGWGQARLDSWLLGVNRGADDRAVANGVEYLFGLEETKVHGTVQGSWQNQWIGPAGVVVSPYAALRGDAAYYDGASARKPDAATLYSLTPIAAMDIRWPLAIRGGDVSQIVEPIGQLVLRGSDQTLVGITNDNAQSFVFDDTNLFSFNRFTGTDRQETGLRANVGARYHVEFGDSWLEVTGGESFHLAGVNALGVVDEAKVGESSGLDDDRSYVVLGAQGSLFGLVKGGGKVQIDPEDLQVTRAGLGVSFANADGYAVDFDYVYLAADEDRGITKDQQEVGAIATVPVDDYWQVKGGVYWDLTANSWLEARAGIAYDDGYLEVGADYVRTGPTHSSPDDQRFMANFKLKGPEGTLFQY